MHPKPQPTDTPPAPHEQRFQLVVETLREVVFQLDTQGRFTYLNPAWTELTGFPVPECLGQRSMDYVHPGDQELSLELGRELVARHQESSKHEMRYLTRDGGFRWVEVYVRLLLAEDGSYAGTCGTINDITERRRAMEALARRERYLTALVEIQQRLLATSSSENLFARLMAPLGEASGASRAYVFEAHRSPDGNQLFSQRAEWCAPGVQPELDNPLLQNMQVEQQTPHLYERLSRGQVLSGLVKNFPPEEREILESQNILSLLALPLWVHGTLAGFIGFDNCAEEREWDKLEVDLLWAAAGAIALAMEQRQSARALRERELRFRRVAENASDVLYRYQLAGTRSFAFVSGVVTKNLGFTPEEHYRDPELWHRQVHPEDLEVLEQLLLEPEKQDTPVVVRFQRRDGRTVWLQHVVTPVLDASGLCVAVEGIARDITERRQFEEALKLSEASFRILLESVPEPAAIQRDGRIIYANTSLVSALGFRSPRDVMGRLLQEFLLDEPPTPEGSVSLVTGERRLRRQDGKVRVAEFASLPLLFDGQPAVVSIARDVTEQRQLQSRLSLADRMASMGTLAAGIAHEINNPLAFVISNLGFLLDETRRMPSVLPPGGIAARPEVDEWRAVLMEAREGAERVRQIVRQLKTFSRPDEERVEPVDVHAVLDSAVMLAANEIKHRAKLKREYGQIPPVRGNEGRLCQVFLNLVVNASQAIPEGAAEQNEIRLVTRMGSEGRVVVEVQDTGSGIPAEALGRIFDPFYTTKPVGVGTGLGLSICHGIITSLGGDISVESEPGRGTTMRVVLRAAEEGFRLEKPAPAPVVAPSARRGRVLIVDDEPAVGKALRRILREHDVELATSGRQALEKLSADTRFHAVLCDVMMPDLGGKDLYEAVQQGGSGLEQRFVFVSGGAFTQGARDFLARVPNPTLEKPFDETAVRRVVRDLVMNHTLPGN
ncbi:PAS domain S-box protein [Vitiosangium sp. GDMCC 1.1324]|uniref:PAS domain-containing hybrid sensor histidine kinase/response regulator n=1 Tax=Vitiosangium sp. (strain GDMCC 1.1324) TaxID=2138576 RepID=UPI000D3DAF7D|nr:PAS domain S-box protein [Vitiosangium sp. GDMCC 1.1324]PTL84862.1 histidine kinase [Vitiosangium sp. GDMCC 1.1324]